MTLNQNQFSQSGVQGMLDLRFNPQTLACAVDENVGTALLPGQAVKIVDSAGGVPKVEPCTLDTDDVFGFVNFNHKDQDFDAEAPVEISAFRGNVMYMTASAAIARGAKVMVVIASNKVALHAGGGQRVIGRALDKATADGDLIRVMIDLPGATS